VPRAERLRRLGLATAAAVVLVLAAGPGLVAALMPAVAWLSDLATPHLVTHAGVVGDGLGARIEARAIIVAAVPVAPSHHVPPLTPIGPVSFTMVHALVPLTLLAATLFAWPCTGTREAARRGVWGVVGGAALVLAQSAVHLAGLVDMTLLDLTARAVADPPMPWTVTALHFLESGGRWLAALLAGAACVLGARARRRRASTAAAGRALDRGLVAVARQARTEYARR
jgi:hypothetical protein